MGSRRTQSGPSANAGSHKRNRDRLAQGRGTGCSLESAVGAGYLLNSAVGAGYLLKSAVGTGYSRKNAVGGRDRVLAQIRGWADYSRKNADGT